MEFNAESIAHLVGGTVDGDPKAVVSSFAKIEEGKPGAISFLANPKYTNYIYSTKSTIVLVANDFKPEHQISCTLIRVPNPYETIAKLMQMVQKATIQLPTGIENPSFIAEGVEIPENAYIGAFSYIGKGAKIENYVKIFPQSYIGTDCSIGEGTIIYPGVKIYHGCKIGKNCIIHSGVVIGADGFGFAPTEDGNYDKIPQLGIVEIQDNVEIGANTTIDRAMMGATHIGEGVKLDNLVQIAHNVQVGDRTVMAAQVGIAGSSKIGQHCMMGGQVGVAGHIAIGDKCEIGAQAGIPNNLPEGSRVIGTPAIPAMKFFRQCAQLRRLSDLFDRVSEIEKEIKH